MPDILDFDFTVSDVPPRPLDFYDSISTMFLTPHGQPRGR